MCLLLLAGQAAGVLGAVAQDDVGTSGDGYHLVARVLPGEWAELAAAIGTPAATPGAGAGVADPSAVSEPLAGEALVAALRAGGHVIYFRHAATDRSNGDRLDAPDFLRDCAAQRDLDAEGLSQARAIGRAFRALGLPVGEVRASEYCRTRKTAELAFGETELTAELTSPFWDELYGGLAADRKAAALRSYLGTPPPAGTNVVLVAHGRNLIDATGVNLGTEGEAAIFRPTDTDGTPESTG